jgi:penicillin-binding protein 1B
VGRWTSAAPATLGRALARLAGRRSWALAGLALGALLVLSGATLAVWTAVELARFARAETRRASTIHAAPQVLRPGVSVRAIDLAGTLARLRYVETRSAPSAPGQFRRGAGTWDVFVRGDGDAAAARIRLELSGDRVARILRGGRPVDAATLEPEVLTSAADRPGEEYRPVRLADVPLALISAVLAAEDHRFFEHGGVDTRGLLRAAWANLRAGRVTQGGSTITQQLVKNRLLGSRRTLWRKVREAWLAAVVEWRYPKPQILEAYLNEAYLGQRGSLAIRGVGAGARVYFGKEVHQLTLAESALLAGMIRAPNSYSPALDPERARQRRDVVLGRMRELGFVAEADREAARHQPVRVAAAGAPGQLAPYFTDHVRQELEQRLGPDATAARVHTTLDPVLQRFAEAAVTRGLDRLESGVLRLGRRAPTDRLQAALVAVEPATGRILALVGGRDYQASQFDRATRARRQPGSAFKPFVYLAALRTRRGGPAFTAASMIDDSPLTVLVNGRPWSPRNYEDHYAGRVRVRRALEMSLNAATVRIAQEVGLRAVIDTARALGLTSALEPVPAMALGAFEVTPLELAHAYLPLANGGRRLAAVTGLAAVDAGDGRPPVALAPDATAAVSPAEAYLVTSLLAGVMSTGTGARARDLGVTGEVAGKTGTTNDGRDAWFVGYTPTLLALVWVGFDGGEPHGLSGARAALPIWADFMRQALDAYPARPFEVPAGIRFAQIDLGNGKLANRYCPVVGREAFLSGTEPAPCDEHGGFGDRLIDWWRHLRDWLGR